MTLQQSNIMLRRHAQRLSGALPLLCVPASVATREFSLFRGIRSTGKHGQQPVIVPVAFRQSSSSSDSKRRSHPSWKLFNQSRKQVGQLTAQNAELTARDAESQQVITGLKEEITGLKASNKALEEHNAILVNRMRQGLIDDPYDEMLHQLADALRRQLANEEEETLDDEEEDDDDLDWKGDRGKLHDEEDVDPKEGLDQPHNEEGVDPKGAN
ncbi:hypothetical protein FN846DRAFT_906131 [Sphaerosporella brunnea]|uniref:Uncharacterized protein n=1 Tax=Sphaerosporella brunnea TaxID=1250544 RepID=A0A5J5EZV5_9PEZI|nr:hypothetical protein FN846DRAFT_906131 [Sphaerosporella brunnea]